MFDRFLIAVDDSACARRAARHGFDLAARYGAAVELVTACRGGATERGRALLDDVAETASGLEIDVETDVLTGKRARAVADRAAESGADLLVVGRCGRSGAKDRLLGSFAERVLRRSDPPVLTVPPGDADAAADYDRVLVSTDGSDVAEMAGPYGAELARRFDASLHVLNVVDVQEEAGVFDAGGVDEEYIERLEERGREAVDDLVETIHPTDLDVSRAVVRGRPAEAIADYAAENDVDLLVMSSEGQTDLVGQRLGTVAGRVLRTVDRPVLVVTSS